MAGANQASLLLQKQLRDLAKNRWMASPPAWSTTATSWSGTSRSSGRQTHYNDWYQEKHLYHAVCPDGLVCISILHPPGDDPNGYELASERWSPVHTVESIVLSIISMLSSPNDKSPANIEAAVSETDSLAAIPRGLERAKGCIQKESKPCCPMLPRTAVSSKEFSLSIKTAAGARSSMVLGSQALCCTFSDLVWFAILLIELLIC